MSAIPSPALALARAFDRFERSSARALDAATLGESAELVSAFVDQGEAKIQVKASVALVRVADEMWDALLSLKVEGRSR